MNTGQCKGYFYDSGVKSQVDFTRDIYFTVLIKDAPVSGLNSDKKSVTYPERTLSKFILLTIRTQF